LRDDLPARNTILSTQKALAGRLPNLNYDFVTFSWNESSWDLTNSKSRASPSGVGSDRHSQLLKPLNFVYMTYCKNESLYVTLDSQLVFDGRINKQIAFLKSALKTCCRLIKSKFYTELYNPLNLLGRQKATKSFLKDAIYLHDPKHAMTSKISKYQKSMLLHAILCTKIVF